MIHFHIHFIFITFLFYEGVYRVKSQRQEVSFEEAFESSEGVSWPDVQGDLMLRKCRLSSASSYGRIWGDPIKME